ncbi:MAG: acyl-CoA dehydrogenase family protein [Hyphomonadaceae bacterium]|nr:acyl-CoA dehydrogenase family protein [Hyphomonadaceae bacterium]
MNFEHSEDTKNWVARVQRFMDEHIAPAIPTYNEQHETGERWKAVPVLEELKKKARAYGLWNLFMPPQPADFTPVENTFQFESPKLSNVTYAAIAEVLGRIGFASEVFNCSAPDSGNMEVLHRYGTLAQKEKWLRPLMNGEMRSAFLMTEPAVASSDATNIETRIERSGDEYVISGRKWWASGVGDPRCKIAIVMGKTDPRQRAHLQQSLILVPLNTPGVKIERLLPVFGFDDAPHGHAEVLLDDVRVPSTNIIAGEGKGFEISQARLGPGRIHHCMRSIGTAEVALEKMCKRLMTRKAFGKLVADHSIWEHRIARARIDIEMTRLLCLKAAYMMDTVGNKVARAEIAMIKVQAPNMALRIIDDAIQAFGGAGVSTDPGLAFAYANQRALRIADGPDEVHERAIARMEFDKNKSAAC